MYIVSHMIQLEANDSHESHECSSFILVLKRNNHLSKVMSAAPYRRKFKV